MAGIKHIVKDFGTHKYKPSKPRSLVAQMFREVYYPLGMYLLVMSPIILVAWLLLRLWR
jgi:hypothetical protein